ncbi:Aste57867_17824 [Aphanomyces stellatus]|uniref:Aste57867_17824 protein n=1 Tax=Aphanomyces stellatus TaxID=120398 RepID=A0A485L8M6_9STRA|nr:hypothetical protein As57867_017763 [Aphanomyces stellatus]VFT94567.1 Aste57867_17824 [Aphanomyces stellatus]
MDGVDGLVKGVVYVFGFAATGWSLMKFVLSVPLKVSDTTDEEKDMELVLQMRSGPELQIFLRELKEQTDLTVRVKSKSTLLGGCDDDDDANNGAKDKSTYLLVGALSPSVYQKLAEDCGLRKQTTKGKWVHIDGTNQKEFVEPVDNDDDVNAVVVPYTSGEKIDLIMYKLRQVRVLLQSTETSSLLSNGDLLFQKAQEKRVLLSSFALHNAAERNALMSTWVKHVKPLDPAPIHRIRDYCGMEVGFYFAFLEHYTSSLVYPAAVGGLVYLYQLHYGLHNFATAMYALFVSAWATIFLEAWKRRESELAWHWGSSLVEEDGVVEERVGFDGPEVYDEIDEVHYKQFTDLDRLKRYAVTGPILCATIAGIVGLMLLYFPFEEYVRATVSPANGWSGLSLYVAMLPSVLYSSAVFFIDGKYAELATRLNEYENHRTDVDHTNALITKLALFQFVNNFGLLFYITFFVGNFELLQSTLGSLLVTRLLIENVIETLIPFIMSKSTVKAKAGLVEQAKLKKEPSKTDLVTVVDKVHSEYLAMGIADEWVGQVDVEALLPVYDGTFFDYLELFIQFGHITLFASAYPLASVLALLNNFIEIKSDGFKILMTHRRVNRVHKDGIGTWLHAFTILSYVAVITNCWLIGFNSGVLQKMYPDITPFYTLVAVLVAEHFIIGAMVGIEAIVPDVPQSVAEGIRRERAAERKKIKMDAEFHRRSEHAAVQKSFFDESVVDEAELGLVATDEAAGTTTIATDKWRKWVLEEKIRRRVLEKEIKNMNAIYTSWIDAEKDKCRRLQAELDARETKKSD